MQAIGIQHGAGIVLARREVEGAGGEVGVKAGDKVKCEVSSIDTIDRRLILTMKNVGAEKISASDTSGKKKKGGGC